MAASPDFLPGNGWKAHQASAIGAAVRERRRRFVARSPPAWAMETWTQPFREIDAAMRRAIEPHRLPLPEARRADADVDHHGEDCAAHVGDVPDLARWAGHVANWARIATNGARALGPLKSESLTMEFWNPSFLNHWGNRPRLPPNTLGGSAEAPSTASGLKDPPPFRRTSYFLLRSRG